MIGPLDWLKSNRVEVFKTTTRDGFDLYFRRPSAFDLTQVNNVIKTVQGSDRKGVEAYLFIPLLWCDAEGNLVFPNYADGVDQLRALKAEPLKELTDLCMESTGLRDLLGDAKEDAEKKS